MEKIAKILIGAFVVVIIAAVLFRGEITGRSIYCSDIPKITSLKEVGDTISISWTDTSKFNGAYKYEIQLFKQKSDTTYDLMEPTMEDVIEKPYHSFLHVEPGVYRIRLKARNAQECSIYYTDYAEEYITKTIS